MIWTTEEKKMFSNSLPVSSPFLLLLFVMDTHQFQKEAFVPVQIRVCHPDTKSHWFVLGKFGFMGRGVRANKVAPRV